MITGIEHVKDSVAEVASMPTMDIERNSAAPLAGACGYEAFEVDFRGHHYTNAARRRGPYEHYRLVYRYGYDLGVDPRYCGAEWATVEQQARPRWEERNPGTWEQFKDTIRYAWDAAQKGNLSAAYGQHPDRRRRADDRRSDR